MNKKRWVLASIAVYIFVMALEMFYNTYVMKDIYAQFASLWRPLPEMMARMPYYWVAALICTFIFVYIYAKGYEAKPCGACEGIRFGLLFGLFVNLTMVTITYATMPITLTLSAYWFVTGMVEYILAGLIAGLIYKK